MNFCTEYPLKDQFKLKIESDDAAYFFWSQKNRREIYGNVLLLFNLSFTIQCYEWENNSTKIDFHENPHRLTIEAYEYFKEWRENEWWWFHLTTTHYNVILEKYFSKGKPSRQRKGMAFLFVIFGQFWQICFNDDMSKIRKRTQKIPILWGGSWESFGYFTHHDCEYVHKTARQKMVLLYVNWRQEIHFLLRIYYNPLILE